MTDRTETPATHALVVLGASGDLTERLLLPGLGTLLASERGRPVDVIGTGRSEVEDDAWRERVAGALRADGRSGALLDGVVERTRYMQGDPTDPEHLRALLDAAAPATPVLYLALPPGVVAEICDALGEVELPDDLLLVFDKPYGTDRGSAASLTRRARELVGEERVFRVDHFLAEPAVRGLVLARAGTPLLDATLDASTVAGIEIVYDEQIALEGRAGYYDASGALVDMLQSHLLHVLALVTADRPAALTAEALGAAVVDLLRRVSTAGPPEHATHRARYTAGTVDGERVPAYADEDGVDPDAGTETLAQLRLEIDDDRWRGVPVVLRSGKAIGDPARRLVVRFRDPAERLPGAAGTVHPRWEVDLGNGSWRLELPGSHGDDVRTAAPLELTGRPAPGVLDAYGTVLAGVLDGDRLLAVAPDAVEECWRIVDPVLAAWRADEVPLEEYPAGSDGPQGWDR